MRSDSNCRKPFLGDRYGRVLKVLLAYASKRGGTASHVQRSLRKVAEVHHVELRGLPDKDVLRARLPWGRTATAAARAVDVKPDLFVEVDGAGRRHLRKPRALGCPTALWAIDSHRAYKREFLRLIGLDFDHVFVAQKDDVAAFRAPHTKPHWLPLACDPQAHKDFGVPRDVDVGYVGSMDAGKHGQRLQALKLLARTYKVEAKGGIYDDDMARLYSRSQVVFNRSIGGDLNMRVFEAMSCGACLVTDRIANGQEELFRDREHLVIYDEWNLLDVVDEFMADEEARTRIAAAGTALVREKHTYDHRVAEMLRTGGFAAEADALLAQTVSARA